MAATTTVNCIDRSLHSYRMTATGFNPTDVMILRGCRVPISPDDLADLEAIKTVKYRYLRVIGIAS